MFRFSVLLVYIFFFVWSLLDNSKYNNVLSDSPKHAIKVH